jgi:hypothetical protein
MLRYETYSVTSEYSVTLGFSERSNEILILISRVGMFIDGLLDSIIRFIDTLFTQLGTTANYSAVADLHSLQFIVAHALGFSVFTSRILATDL